MLYINMKKIFYILLVLLISSCAVTKYNEAKRNRFLVVDNIRMNNNYQPWNKHGRYIVTAFEVGTWREYRIETNILYNHGDTIYNR
jgi:hypothetical protein